MHWKIHYNMLLIIKNDEIFYTLYQDNETHSDIYEQVSGVKFTDYNMDGKKDILILVEYSHGENHWNQPLIFLQENADNMVYLDYPDLENYKLKGDTIDGISFYRDTFLEEYHNYAENYFSGKESVKNTIHLTWKNVSDIASTSKATAIEKLTEASQ